MKPTLWLFVVLATPLAAQEQPMIVTQDVKLPGGVLKTPLVIQADGLTIDGQGTTIQGPGEPGKLATFLGIGITAQGRKGITLRNVKVRGWRSALVITDASEWTIDGCDVSGNYHDPDFGWGDGERVGGIILDHVSRSRIVRCTAHEVWNGLDLWRCDDNTIERCDFSHCSNVCLKLETSSRNVVRDCNLSWGLRIKPGEVHARDSTSVLIESGSDGNRFEHNDITHGGDGVFIRVLNAWVSTGNVFVENDCSHANNNGFESWSPGNTYLRNKANHCSFGFWLGGSDHTVLEGNEAGFNGRPDGFHNAPEPDFVHGGIVIVGGTGTHTLIEDNWCHDNNGAGIVVRGDLGTRGRKWPMHHLVIQRNRLENNRWGLFARFTDGLDLAGNTFQGNQQDERIEEVTGLARHAAGPEAKERPRAVITGPARVKVGAEAVFDATGSTGAAGRALAFVWRVVPGDWSAPGETFTTPKIAPVFAVPGFYRVGLTVNDGRLAHLAWVDVYAVQAVDEVGTEGQATQWTWTMGGQAEGRGRLTVSDAPEAIVGAASLHLRADPYPGAEVIVRQPAPGGTPWDLAAKKQLSFWVRFRNENIGGFQGPNPIVRLHRGPATWTYLPLAGGATRNLLMDLPYSEAREGWLRVVVPLDGGGAWRRFETVDGAVPPHFDHGLRFTTVRTEIETQESSSLASDGSFLWCASVEGDRLFRSKDGVAWEARPGPGTQLGRGSGGWMGGMLAFFKDRGPQGTLYLRHVAPERNEWSPEPAKLAAFDIASGKWSFTPTLISMTHGTAVVGHELFGLSHARGGNFGGPLARVDLKAYPKSEERTVLDITAGDTPGWMSRAAKLAVLGGRVFGIKNDWTTPPPAETAKIGDRLYCFDPRRYQPSMFAGGNPDDERQWKEAKTPVDDLGPLPFEVGHGSVLVALPPKWSPLVGAQGGLLIVAGCSPSNHEGFGVPSSRFAIYDLETRRFTVGALPGETGSGTSAALHAGQVFIKRGGMNFGPTNAELWVVEAVPATRPGGEEEKRRAEAMTLRSVDGLSLQFDSVGGRPFDVWLDGLAFE